MKRRPILIFFVLALLISWAGWIPYAAAQAGKLSIQIPSEIIWLAEFGPTISALIVTFMFFGKSGLKEIIKRLLKWNVKLKWYLFAILVSPLLIFLSLAIQHLLFGTSFDLDLLGNWDINFINRTAAFTPSVGIISGLVTFMKTGAIATGLTFLILALTNGGLSEEIGWRGFALERFQNQGLNILLSSLFVSILWAVWHTGTLFWKTLFTSSFGEGLAFAGSYLLQYLLLVFPLSIIYTILYNGTKGSILLAIILHACYNISIAVFATALPNFPMLTFVGVLFIFAAILSFSLWKNKTYNKPMTANEIHKS